MTRGVIYIVWNRSGIDAELQQSIQSLKRSGLPHTVIERKSESTNRKQDLGLKADMYDLTPYESTLFLDSDTVVLTDDLSYGFRKAEQHGMAISLDPACFACRGENKGQLHENVIEYNTGVIFFSRQERVKSVFAAWKKHRHVTENDQIGFAKAVEELDYNPFVLPKNWNFRGGIEKQYFGPIRIFHSRERLPADRSRKDYIFQNYRGAITRKRIVNVVKRYFRQAVGG